VASRHNTSSEPGAELDAARALVVARDLTTTAVGALTEMVRTLPFEALAPVKQLLKQFFSDQPWTGRDDAALAEIVGRGEGSERLALDRQLTLIWGWESGRFVLRVRHDGRVAAEMVDETGSDVWIWEELLGEVLDGRAADVTVDGHDVTDVATPAATAGDALDTAGETDLGLTFEREVFPEVTPSPRTIRFTTPPLHDGPSRIYNSSAEATGDARAERIFAEFDAVTTMLVGPDFVAITISRPDQWDALLAPMLVAVTEEFTTDTPEATDRTSALPGVPAPGAGSKRADPREPRRLERAWAELGALRADRPEDLGRIVAATRDPDPAHRQVAAALLADAPPDVAADGWNRLFSDDSRNVRRSVIDAVVDSHREELRTLLEAALADPDAWTRWKAVHGIAALGVTSSRGAVEVCASDLDFRVRLEAVRALAR
jgi:hypothetical protein